MIDEIEFAKQMGVLIREAVAPLAKRLEELETAVADSEKLEVSEVVGQILQTDQLKTLVDLQAAESVAQYMAEHPIKHGKDGEDGVGLAGGTIDRDGELVLTNTRGEAIKLGVVVGSNGKKGQDGADFTNVEIEYDGERTLTITGTNGVLVKRLPIPIDRGYWREGTKAEQADVMTHDGSAWIALKNTSAKPGHDAKEDWRMLARKGRDGVEPKRVPVTDRAVALANG